MVRRAATLTALVLGLAAGLASGQSLLEHFDYPAATTIPNWGVEFGGDWSATGSAVASDVQTGWQYLLRDAVQDRDGVVEALVRYDAPAHLQAAGPIARATIRDNVLRTYLVKTQDNSRTGTGSFNTGYLYYYESPLVFLRLAYFSFSSVSTLVRTRILVMDEASSVRVMGFWDLDLDGVWDHRVTVQNGAGFGEAGRVGLNGFSRCLVDEWRYFDACLYARDPAPRPGQTLELVARSRPNAVYLAASSLARTGIPLGGGKIIPLWPDCLMVASRDWPGIFRNFTGVFDAAGDAALEVVIPAVPALVGQVFYTAFVALSATQPGQVEEVSNDAQVRISG
ncbi:MAG: hypothetical protein JXQ29_16495 [Planctomycetes bacterium]|nr:hypothetical protein [Planctomycetota bacterium]